MGAARRPTAVEEHGRQDRRQGDGGRTPVFSGRARQQRLSDCGSPRRDVLHHLGPLDYRRSALTYLSMPSAIPNTFCSDWGQQDGEPLDAQDEASYAAVVTANLLSLDAPPLPAGYGFVLVNREGRVLYHSDRRLSLRENFFDELSQGARVRAMTYSGLEGPLTSRYRERPHQLYLHPLDWQRAPTARP